MDYKLIICGGTFDRLHAGHTAFLDFVFSKSQEAIIGITSDLYSARYKPDASVLPYRERRKEVEEYLQEKNLFQRTHLYEIDDVVGPGADPLLPLEAIIVTEDTQKGALILNQARNQQSLSSLPVITMPLVPAISSTAIRAGNIDTTGAFFIEEKWKTQKHILPYDLRKELQEPLGILLQEVPKKVNKEKIITVGDITTQRFLQHKIVPHIAVIDFIVERTKRFQQIEDLGFSGKEETFFVKNEPALLTPALWEVIAKMFAYNKDHMILRVAGEEDLAVIPLVLSAPLGWVLYYGQPHQGLVEVPITLEKKRETYVLLKRFL